MASQSMLPTAQGPGEWGVGSGEWGGAGCGQDIGFRLSHLRPLAPMAGTLSPIPSAPHSPLPSPVSPLPTLFTENTPLNR
jgi:hypothetical protein